MGFTLFKCVTLTVTFKKSSGNKAVLVINNALKYSAHKNEMRNITTKKIKMNQFKFHTEKILTNF